MGVFPKKMTMSREWSGVLTPKAQEAIYKRWDKSRFLHTVIWSIFVPFNPMLDALELPDIVYTTVMQHAARRTGVRSETMQANKVQRDLASKV
ncbi:hypothetical protein AMTR_s00026p00106470 [Amborella trichopoda]|uniref:Uncharacterized protein n=1 Tax=Amborella trichopoda TaxID=13333 RepID=W1PRB3_AMBTC|nr:hypothetical protein AMTR_s00026p00106470 [Amborella trichopoda]